MLNLTKHQEVLGQKFLCATLTSADNNVEQFLRLKEENDVLNATNQFSNSMVFRINISNMSIDFIGESIATFYLNNVHENFVEEILKRKLIYEEDVETFLKLISNIKNGIVDNCKMRLKAIDGRKDWYFIEYIVNKDASGNLLSATGKITNIQKTQELQDKASRDLLTSCYNKITFEDMVERVIEEKSDALHAFIMIDLDDFKSINDNLGHYFGDIVLKEAAEKIKRIFRGSDYIGRIGGVESAFVSSTDISNIISKKNME